MKRFFWAFLVLSLFILPAQAVHWPEERNPFGVPGTDQNLHAYVSHVVREYPISTIEDDETPTLNRMGTTMKKVGPFPAEFIEFAAKCNLPVLSVGEGTGNITEAALARNITFIANDMDRHHLAHLYASVPQDNLSHLFLKAGKFPDEVKLPEGTLGAIYFGRILHFQTGEEIERSLAASYKLLHSGGKVFARASTPFQKHLQFFMPTYYYERIEKGDPWPGVCTNMAQGWPALHQYLPPFMNLLDTGVLKRTLIKTHFEIEDLRYTPIRHPEFKLDGREGIGFVARKD